MVIDGHGGRAAADFVAENLGRNIMNEIKQAGNVGNQIEAAIRRGYSVTDHQFLNQVDYITRQRHLKLSNFGQSSSSTFNISRSV